ncbi:IclR family transcriptional regulator [Salinibaculum rarum]|uniref:IclR family transcriptional regulator n=1 Tax=Salinibaculum rarum TaxID=3058903 RepID=UPI00265F9A21|nr:IclR family transcriptional regulator [Salinibaculum sp. KK48]
MTEKPKSVVRTSEKTFAIIDVLLANDGMRINDLTDELDLTKSTVYRHLTTLSENGYVIKEGEVYRLSLKFLTIGGQLRRQIPAYPMIKTKIDDLAEKTGERAQFMLREQGDRVYIQTETGENPVQTGAHVGTRGPIYASAAGKAILAGLPESKRESVVEQLTLEATGPNTITERSELKEELMEIREQGYAINRQESTRGVHAIGTAVQSGDEIIGALSVSGPATRLKDDRLESELPDVVRAASNELELHIEHQTSNPVGTSL